MGGSIAVTIRKSNGTEYRMRRWTNSLPSFVQNPKFFKEDKIWFDEYIQPWLDMKKDYDKNKATKRFKHNMTDVYFPYSALAPDDYGLVIIDYTTNTILSMQGYCTFGIVMLHKSGEFHSAKTKQNYIALKKAKLIKGYSDWSKPKNLKKKPDFKKSDFMFAVVDFNKARWTYKEFDESEKGCKKLLKKIKTLGFKISAKDKKKWNEYLQSL